MNYERIYNDLIKYRQNNILISDYIENHHIIPRSLGGTDEKTNIVALTGREHYIAHLLLAKFNRCKQTIYALWMMQMKNSINTDRPCIKTGRMYEWARKEFAKYAAKNNIITSKGIRNSQHGTIWICNLNLKENRKISKDSLIPDGWIVGRNNWNIKNSKISSKLINKRISEEIYNIKPCNCKQCGNILPFIKRKNSFCDRSCKASFTNTYRKKVYHSTETKNKISQSKKLTFLNKKAG
jgi:hypothetical protein